MKRGAKNLLLSASATLLVATISFFPAMAGTISFVANQEFAAQRIQAVLGCR